MPKKVALLGATSHIAKGLIWHFVRNTQEQLFLFARSKDKIEDFLGREAPQANAVVGQMANFADGTYDVVINCVGIGPPSKIKAQGAGILGLTQEYDDVLIGYLSGHPTCQCINFSSGVVSLGVSGNNTGSKSYYTTAKIDSEAKHRARPDLAIADIRVYGYFSRFIDMDSGFFLTDIIQSVRQHKELHTNAEDIVRDYIHPGDLFQLVQRVMSTGPGNCVLDAYSAKPVRKFEVLDFFKQRYGLVYRIDNGDECLSPTGFKKEYGATSRDAQRFGYDPQWTSMEVIKQESAHIFQ